MKSDNLKNLKKRLYKKGESFKERGERPRIYGRRESLPSSHWPKPSARKKKGAFFPLKVLLAASFVFFLVSLSAFLYFWLGDSNVVSSGNIGVEIKGPPYVQGGEINTLDIFVENKNNTDLEMADLIVDFPESSFSSDGSPLSRERYSFGTIAPGASIKKTISVVLLGKEDEEKNIKATLEYRLAQSNAIFAKSGSYTVKISRPPVGVSLLIPKEINAKREMEVKVGIVSNSEAVIRNLVLRLDYPSGFQFSGATPSPSRKNNLWKIGDFDPSQERNISIRGIVEGQDLEEKAFRATAGVIKADGTFIPYGESAETVVVKKPYIDLVLFVNGKDSEKNIASAGDSLRVEVAWKNNLSSPVRDAKVSIKIKGAALDQKSISVSKGFYRTFDKTLLWNSASKPELSAIDPGEVGRAQFSFSILNPLPVRTAGDKNFAIELEGSIEGTAISGTSQSGKIQNSITKEIKIGSRLQLAAAATHYSGPFKNTGPMPPRVGEETTYTITWSLGNNVNDFSGVKVSAPLPSYMRWLGKISPSGENVSFDDVSGNIVWDAGAVPAGTGIVRPAREVSFQVALDPNLSQVGSSPELIGKTSLEAKDEFTGETLKDEKSALTTRLTRDPQFTQRESEVTE
ncbi:MAG: hypothetical protein GXP44_01860 [bacterium]|nr:hypothetical protein [bacterium]